MITAPLLLVPHNWDESVKRRLSWKTDILVPINGTEYRRRLRQNPVERLSYHLTHLDATEESEILGVIWGATDLRVAVPRWEDAMLVADPITATDTVVTVTIGVSNRRMVGDAVIYWEGNGYELVEIDTAVGTTLTLVAGAANTWPSGVLIVPVVEGYLESPVDGETYGQLKGHTTLSVRVEEDIAGITTDPGPQAMVPSSIAVHAEAIGQEGTLSRGDVQALVVTVLDANGNIIPNPDVVASGYDASHMAIYPNGQQGVFNVKNLKTSGPGSGESITFTSGPASATDFYIYLD